jgi:putative peptidoglycan lipid II flippase
MAVVQINIFVSTILASFLPEGSITYLYYSMRLIQFPIGVFGVAIGMAALPALSEHSARGEIDKVKEDFSFSLRLLFFITVPAMIGLIALNEPIVSTLFQRGKFDYAATLGTSEALMFYSLGIWAIVGARIITAAFYSMQDTKTPVKIAAAAMLINILFSLALMGPMKHNGLALANTIAVSCNFMLLFYFLRKRLGGLGTKKITSSFFKTLSASLIMGIAGWFIARSETINEIWQISGHSLQKAAYLTAAIVICAGIYMALAYLLKSDEIGYIINKIRSRKPKIRNQK